MHESSVSYNVELDPPTPHSIDIYTYIYTISNQIYYIRVCFSIHLFRDSLGSINVIPMPGLVPFPFELSLGIPTKLRNSTNPRHT